MALTPFRWTALALIGCMLVVLGLVSAVDSQAVRQYRRGRPAGVDSVEWLLRQRAGGLNQDVQNLARRYRTQFIIDSVMRWQDTQHDDVTLMVIRKR